MSKYRETETVECKQIVTAGLLKEIIAFANTYGGDIYIGIDDRGAVCGVENPDTCIQQITNMVRDSIKPDITLFSHYEVEMVGDKAIVHMRVERGVNRPYYIAKKGLRPEGVFVRQGTSSVGATDAFIRQAIKDSDGDSYEQRRSLVQDLQFIALQKECQRRNLILETEQMRTLGILNENGLYTNLGRLLSEQCEHTVKLAVFEDSKTSFRDRQEFCGSLITQLNDTYAYIQQRNQMRSTYQQLYRVDVLDYPEVALREALLNMLVHREYSFSAGSFIRMYKDRIEITTLGGIPTGISLDDIQAGVSVCRNPKLASIFYRLGLIEAYGTGIQKIMDAYESCDIKPRIEVTPNTFKISLPNRNEQEHSAIVREKIGESYHAKENYSSSPEQRVLAYIRLHGRITRKETEVLLSIKQTAAGKLLRLMEKKELLLRLGGGRSVWYVVRK